jgi:hypothetical protein
MSDNAAVVLLLFVILSFLAVVLWLVVMVITSPVGLLLVGVGVLAFAGVLAVEAIKRNRTAPK